MELNTVYCEYNIFDNVGIIALDANISNDNKIYKIDKNGGLYEILEKDNEFINISPKNFSAKVKAYYQYCDTVDFVCSLRIKTFDLEFYEGKLIKHCFEPDIELSLN